MPPIEVMIRPAEIAIITKKFEKRRKFYAECN